MARALFLRSRPARHRGLPAWFGQIAAYRSLIGVVQPAAFGTVPAIAVVLKLVVMPGDARLLDRGALLIIHMHTSQLHLIPAPADIAGSAKPRPRGQCSAFRRRFAHLLHDAGAEVTFAAAAPERNQDIDSAYHTKYDRYGPAIVGHVTGPAAYAVTIRLIKATQ
jgi:Uncharacterized protein conserved in bacteria (DUF2255)